MDKASGFTRKELAQLTGAKFYVIDYLRQTNRLPLLRPTRGRGDPSVFAFGSVDIINRYLHR